MALPIAHQAQAQIVTDGSLGPATALKGPAFQIPADLGRIVGPNLFHSFRTFAIGSGESANFSGPSTVENLLARVTGGEKSTINGSLKCSIAGANLFLVNPAGVVFGPGAAVDVGGAVSVTTADYVRLADGGRFDARQPANDVLTVAAPSSFGFLPPPSSQRPASVDFDGSFIATAPGRTLTVVAGGISAGGGTRLLAPGAALQVAAVASGGEVPREGVSLTEVQERGDVVVQGDSVLTTTSEGGGGRFVVRAHDLRLIGQQEGSFLNNNTLEKGAGGNSEVELTGTLSLSGQSAINCNASGSGNGGDLTIQASRIELNGGQIHLWNLGSGTGSDLSVEADTLGLSLGYITAKAMGSGPGGDIGIRCGDARLTDLSKISTEAVATGRAGSISLTCLGRLSLDIDSTIESLGEGSGRGANAGAIRVVGKEIVIGDPAAELPAEIAPGGILSKADGDAQGGEIDIRADTIYIGSQGQIRTHASGSGAAGDLNVSGRELLIDGRGELSGVASQTTGSGAAGNVALDFDRVSIRDGGSISVSTHGPGNAGQLTLTADELSIDGRGRLAGLSSDSAEGRCGEGGEIVVSGSSVRILDGGTVSASTLGLGTGGNIVIRADTLRVEGAGSEVSSTSVSEAAAGRAGDIEVVAGRVELLNGGALRATTAGLGSGGSIAITSDSVTVRGNPETKVPSRISTGSFNQARGGDAGGISIVTGNLVVGDLGLITSDTWNSGTGGSILVEARTLHGEDRSMISTDSLNPKAGGPAGTISIRCEDLGLVRGSVISSATRGPGAGGTITIEAGSVALDGQGAWASIVTESRSAGDGGPAGRIRITASEVALREGGEIGSSTWGAGAGGRIEVTADSIRMEGVSQVSTAAAAGGVAGDIRLESRSGPITVARQSEVSSASGNGRAGDILLQSSSWIEVDDSRLTVRSEGGDAGTISLKAVDQIVVRNSLVSAQAQLDGGDIIIQPQILGLENGLLYAHAIEGDGGHIEIAADFMYQLGNSDIRYDSANASAQPGTLSIRSAVDFGASLTSLRADLATADQELREGCARRNPRANSFMIRGKGGMAARPDAFVVFTDGPAASSSHPPR